MHSKHSLTGKYYSVTSCGSAVLLRMLSDRGGLRLAGSYPDFHRGLPEKSQRMCTVQSESGLRACVACFGGGGGATSFRI